MSRANRTDHPWHAQRVVKTAALRGVQTREMRRVMQAAMELGESAIQISQGTFESWVQHFNRLVSEEIAS